MNVKSMDEFRKKNFQGRIYVVKQDGVPCGPNAYCDTKLQAQNLLAEMQEKFPGAKFEIVEYRDVPKKETIKKMLK